MILNGGNGAECRLSGIGGNHGDSCQSETDLIAVVEVVSARA